MDMLLGVLYGLTLAFSGYAVYRVFKAEAGGIAMETPDTVVFKSRTVPILEFDEARVLDDVEFDMHTELDDIIRDTQNGVDSRS